ncbi:MAG: lysoplasmalogenase family protein [Candidatus Izemoplasmatales bacterium]
MLYLILGILFLSWLLFIYLIIKDRRLDGFYIKGFTSFVFVFLYFYGLYNALSNSLILINDSYIILMISLGLGLVLGLIGDLFLEVQYFYPKLKIKQIKYGMIIFGFGHIFYLIGMTEIVSFNYFSLLIGLIMTLITYFGSKVLKLDFGKLKLFSYGYSFIIFTMVGQSIFQALDLKNTYSILFMIGAILFGISDLLLAPIYFKEEKNYFFVISNLGTYYLGQTLIALSIYYLL